MGEKILIVEDEVEISELIELYLKGNGYKVVTASDGKEALLVFNEENPSLVVLDILLPGLNGVEVCRKIRERSNVPILFLSAKNDSDDIIKGLNLGGDDYVTKPFDPSVLVARVKANLRRVPTVVEEKAVNEKEKLVYGNLEIDLTSYTIKVNGEAIQLFAKELQLLILLAQHPNQVFSVEQIYSRIWGTDSFGDTRTVMVHISNLRKKIEVDPTKPKFIQTVRGFGYKFDIAHLK